MPQTHYERLGLTASASALELKERYRALAKELHPDRASQGTSQGEGAEGRLTEEERLEAMSALNEAYHVLSDPERRAAYDAELAFKAEQARFDASPVEPFTPSRPSRWVKLVVALSLCAVAVVITLNWRSPNKRQLMDEYQAAKPLLEPRLKALQRGELPSLKEGLESPEGLLLKGVLSSPTTSQSSQSEGEITPERCLEAFPERLQAR
jgi:curved DNA-binding protein CbpA